MSHHAQQRHNVISDSNVSCICYCFFSINVANFYRSTYRRCCGVAVLRGSSLQLLGHGAAWSQLGPDLRQLPPQHLSGSQLIPQTQLRVATCRWTSGHSLNGTWATSGTWNRRENCSASTPKLESIPRLVPHFNQICQIGKQIPCTQLLFCLDLWFVFFFPSKLWTCKKI